MAYVFGNVPFFDCLARTEYTRGLASGHGEFIKGYAHAVRCVRGSSLMFQVAFEKPHGGASFLLPIEALAWKECALPADMTYVQPWDCYSSDFGVCEMDMMKRGAAMVLPDRIEAQYRFTIDFVGNDLAEHFEQHKALHICHLANGLIGAFPNNRLLWSDPAFWEVSAEKPPFTSLGGEYRAEGNQHIFKGSVAPDVRILDAAE